MSACLTWQHSTAADFHTNLVYNISFSLPGENQNITSINNDPLFEVQPLWSIDASNVPGALITPEGANQRTIAYDPGQATLLLASRSAATESNYTIYALSAFFGTNAVIVSTNDDIVTTNVWTLSTNGIYNGGAVGEGGIGIASLAVADDGAVYACNMTVDACGCGPDAGPNPEDSVFRIYRWTNGIPGVDPIQIFEGDPAGLSVPTRWGDTLAARGSGTNTQLLVDSADGKYVALLTPTDDSLTTFTSTFFTNRVGVTPLARTLEFAGTTNFIQKGKGDSWRIGAWNVTNTTFSIQGSSRLPATVGQIAFNGAGQTAAIEFSGKAAKPDLVSVYTFLGTPALSKVAVTNFDTDANSNPDLAGKIIFNDGLFTGNNIWALDANHGLMALNVIGPRTVAVHTAIAARLATADLITALGRALGSNNLRGAKLLYKITDVGTTNLNQGLFLRIGANDTALSNRFSVAAESGAVINEAVSARGTNDTRYAISGFSMNTPLLQFGLQGLFTEKFSGSVVQSNALEDASFLSATVSSLDGIALLQGSPVAIHGSATISGRKIEIVPDNDAASSASITSKISRK